MNSEFVTQDNAIATTLGYLYGSDSLVKIRFDDSGTLYTFSVPAEDAKLITVDYENGQLSIADLLSWYKEQSRIMGTIRAMRRRGDVQWVSRYWVQGIDKEGNKIK
ncbi:MAG: hypothetical protein WA182_13905 [Candidatus Sulfotelmatobacter sp.]